MIDLTSVMVLKKPRKVSSRAALARVLLLNLCLFNRANQTSEDQRKSRFDGGLGRPRKHPKKTEIPNDTAHAPSTRVKSGRATKKSEKALRQSHIQTTK